MTRAGSLPCLLLAIALAACGPAREAPPEERAAPAPPPAVERPAGERAAEPAPRRGTGLDAGAFSAGPPPGRPARLPPGAAQAVAGVRAAAAAGDFAALRGHMADQFSWSFGGDLSADLAVERWRERPTLLAELIAMIDRGCTVDEETGRVVCPPEYLSDPDYLGFRAGFDRRNGGWKMIFFVAGD